MARNSSLSLAALGSCRAETAATTALTDTMSMLGAIDADALALAEVEPALTGEDAAVAAAADGAGQSETTPPTDGLVAFALALGLSAKPGGGCERLSRLACFDCCLPLLLPLLVGELDAVESSLLRSASAAGASC